MSDQLAGVVIGGIIGIGGSVIGALINYWLTVRRDNRLRELEQVDKLRSQLTHGAPQFAIHTGGVKLGHAAAFDGNLEDIAGSGTPTGGGGPGLHIDHEAFLKASARGREWVAELETVNRQHYGYLDPEIEIARSVVVAIEKVEERLKELSDSGLLG